MISIFLNAQTFLQAVPIREQERGRSNRPKSSQTRDHTPPGSIFVNNPALYRMPGRGKLLIKYFHLNQAILLPGFLGSGVIGG